MVNGGKFGERWSKIAAVRGLKVVEIDVAWGQAVTPAQVEQALREHPEAKGVFMQVCETSTAAQHPVEAIARLTRTREVLLVADGISAVGISPCPMDAWGIDCLLTGSQKGLMVPPGMALMALSARAWKRAESIPCLLYTSWACNSWKTGAFLRAVPVRTTLRPKRCAA